MCRSKKGPLRGHGVRYRLLRQAQQLSEILRLRSHSLTSLRMTGNAALVLLIAVCVFLVLGTILFVRFPVFAQQSSVGVNVGITPPSTGGSGAGGGCSTAGNSILKGNGSGGCTNANSGVDYAPATSGTAIQKGNGSGGFSSAVSGTDYVPPIDSNNHTTLQANDAALDGNHINEIGTDSHNNVVVGGGAANAIVLGDSAGVNQGSFTSGSYLDAPVVNTSFTGGIEQCAQKWHEYTLAANSTITLSCPALMGNPQQTLDFFFVQPQTGTTYTYAFAAGGSATLLGDTPTACNVNGCIDQVEVTWVPALNDYIVNLVKANITGVGSCPSGQTCYYVSNSTGSDSNSGLDSGHPWQTLAKVQGMLSTLNPGDEVLFHTGETWTASASNTSIIFGDTSAHAVAGTVAKAILFSTYGGSGRAIIDGNNVNGSCFSAYNPSFSVKYFTISNIECKHTIQWAIYFKGSSGSSAPLMPGITISNNYVHDTGPGCATTNGNCLASPPAWSTTSYAVGSIIMPSTNNGNLSYFQNTAACTASGSQPNWNGAATIGNTISDSGCTWTNVANSSPENYVAWAASTAYASSGGFGGYGAMYINPVSGNAGGYIFQETASSCTSGGSAPTWPQTAGNTVSDNTCTWKNTGIVAESGYANQVGLEDDGVTAGHSSDGVHILNNIVMDNGGWNAIEVHYDTGAVLVQGNAVGPGCQHGCIDTKGVGNSSTSAQILSNTAHCGFGSNLCGCQGASTCATIGNTPAFYTQNTVSGLTEYIIYQLNTAYDSGIGFSADNASGAYYNLRYYNNNAYIPTSGSTYGGWFLPADPGAGGSSIDFRNNISDGGSNHCVGGGGGLLSATEDYNDIGGSQGCPSFIFNGGMTRGSHDLYCTGGSCAGSGADPLYVNASASPPNFGLQSGSPCKGTGLSGLTTGNTDIGAY